MGHRTYPTEMVKQCYLMRVRDKLTRAKIAEITGVGVGTIGKWEKKYHWFGSEFDTKSLEAAAVERYMTLVGKPHKTQLEINELHTLGENIKCFTTAALAVQNRKTSLLNPSHANAGGKKHRVKNDVKKIPVRRLKQLIVERCYEYQRDWWNAREYKNRMVLKSRRIGGTDFFALDVLVDAIEHGQNGIFISASKNQTFVFRSFIKNFVREHFDFELAGSERIELSNGATLYFLGTNVETVQGYGGNLVIDEFAWIGKLEQIMNVAKPIAQEKQYKRAFISTPSTILSYGYKAWNGEAHNKNRRKDRVAVDLAACKAGCYTPEDMTWRQTVTVENAVARGNDRLDVNEIRSDYSEHEFANKFLCKWVDPATSVFSYTLLQSCAVDAAVEWEDVDCASEPEYNGDVAIGYDPSRTRDDAVLAVLAVPTKAYPFFRHIKSIRLRAPTFEAQSQTLLRMTEMYNVVYMGIDRTGIGQAVFDLVKARYPLCRDFYYSPEIKARLVTKGLQLFQDKRFLYDAGQTDIPMAFLSIKKSVTAVGNVVYSADRTGDTGHADVAFAILHAMQVEPLRVRMDQNEETGEAYVI